MRVSLILNIFFLLRTPVEIWLIAVRFYDINNDCYLKIIDFKAKQMVLRIQTDNFHTNKNKLRVKKIQLK